MIVPNMYRLPWVFAHPSGCNQEFPYFPKMFQYVSALFPNMESFIMEDAVEIESI